VRFAIATTDAAMTGNRAPDLVTLVQGGSDPATFSLPVDAGVLRRALRHLHVMDGGLAGAQDLQQVVAAALEGRYTVRRVG